MFILLNIFPDNLILNHIINYNLYTLLKSCTKCDCFFHISFLFSTKVDDRSIIVLKELIIVFDCLVILDNHWIGLIIFVIYVIFVIFVLFIFISIVIF